MTTRGDLDPFAETDDVRRHHLPDALIPDPNVPSGLDDPGSLEEPPRLIVPHPPPTLSEHRQDGPAVPGGPPPYLVLV